MDDPLPPNIDYDWIPVELEMPRSGQIVVGLRILDNGDWIRQGMIKLIGSTFWRIDGAKIRQPTHWRYRVGDPKVAGRIK